MIAIIVSERKGLIGLRNSVILKRMLQTDLPLSNTMYKHTIHTYKHTETYGHGWLYASNNIADIQIHVHCTYICSYGSVLLPSKHYICDSNHVHGSNAICGLNLLQRPTHQHVVDHFNR